MRFMFTYMPSYFGITVEFGVLISLLIYVLISGNSYAIHDWYFFGRKGRTVTINMRKSGVGWSVLSYLLVDCST